MLRLSRLRACKLPHICVKSQPFLLLPFSDFIKLSDLELAHCCLRFISYIESLYLRSSWLYFLVFPVYKFLVISVSLVCFSSKLPGFLHWKKIKYCSTALDVYIPVSIVFQHYQSIYATLKLGLSKFYYMESPWPWKRFWAKSRKGIWENRHVLVGWSIRIFLKEIP